MLEAKNLCVTLGNQLRVDSVNLHVKPGELVAIIGPNGAGKSTLLKLITGEVRADSGTIHLTGRRRENWDRRALARRLAAMGQTPSLAFDFTVKELVALGRAPHQREESARHDVGIIEKAIEVAGLKGFEQRSVPSLSGGERQRAFFAKTVAQVMTDAQSLPGDGTLLLLDEPTSALDLAQQARVLGSTRDIVDAGGAVLCVLHDLNLAAAFADRICVLVNGQLVAQGPPADILNATTLSEWYGCNVDVHASKDGLRKVIALSPGQVPV